MMRIFGTTRNVAESYLKVHEGGRVVHSTGQQGVVKMVGKSTAKVLWDGCYLEEEVLIEHLMTAEEILSRP